MNIAAINVENRDMKMERDILKKATAFFAKESR
jgi:transposase-like protein